MIKYKILLEPTRQKTSSKCLKWDRSFTMRDCKLNISSSVTVLFQARFEMPSKMAFKWLSWNNLLHLEDRLQKEVIVLWKW